ncbi:VOC family protein [Aeromicrobium sp.]|uniref:VOC family protein n=1 Tax=Aeromicrobium sp. TaxID=1871063 RepID=UPI003D6B0F69
MDEPVPHLLHTVLDAEDVRELAEFYRQLLGLQYRAGDERQDGGSDDADWLVLMDGHGNRRLAFQKVPVLPRVTWPEDGVAQQLHLDMSVPSVEELDRQHRRALDLGARLLLDRTDDPKEPLRVYADLAGHPFCILVG